MRCVNVEFIETDSDLYDLEIDGGDNNYVAEGIVVHNTWCMIGLVPKRMAHPTEGRLVVSSKGLAAQGMAMKPNADANKENLYLRVARHLNMENRISFAFGHQLKDEDNPVPVFVLGEVFGVGVQDLGYGAKTDADNDIGFRVFDVYVGKPPSGCYLNDKELDNACERLGLPRVPVLYRGPYWHSKVAEYTDGRETISGKGMHIREGIVVRPCVERKDPKIGRVQLKSVSGDYLTRKNGTEYN
jgi:RNA ligase (TIGR02306 family)